MEHKMEIFGYFNSIDQTKPAYDPSLNVLCPFCLTVLSTPMKTVSLLKPGSSNSYFYRSHKNCYERASEEEITLIESNVIDIPDNENGRIQ